MGVAPVMGESGDPGTRISYGVGLGGQGRGILRGSRGVFGVLGTRNVGGQGGWGAVLFQRIG